MSEHTYLATLPGCDVCTVNGVDRPAAYDAKTVYGPWAYLCLPHYRTHARYTELGTGKGQRLHTREGVNT